MERSSSGQAIPKERKLDHTCNLFAFLGTSRELYSSSRVELLNVILRHWSQPLDSALYMELPSVPDQLESGSQSEVVTTSIPSPARYPSPPPEPDRKACKERSQRTPNSRVWAHRIIALVAYHDDWSPSMVKVADEKHVYDPPFHEQVFGVRLKSGVDLSDEPKPRKLRMWPILMVADGMQCNEELQKTTDEIAKESGLRAENIPKEKASRLLL
ncbi:hypothetical protein FB451DRAFT_1195920 [Mycena latifolia]|nr:hypothetical protein FB451DRAFT_1195920 [Mycena latifolia]